MIIYFSGTGNSRYCAKLLADRLNDRLMDSFHFIRDGVAAELCSDTPWVFVSPTYAWRLPKVFAQFLHSGTFSGCRDAWFVMTCGQDTGAPEEYNRALCQSMGLRYRGTLPVVMPENYIALFSAPSPEQARQIISAAHPTLEKGAALIQAQQDFPPIKTGITGPLKSGPINSLFYHFYVKSNSFTVSDECISCGQCQRDCPLGNVTLQDGRPVWGNHCTHCMACICGCPVSAIEYGRISRGKHRYQCPEYGN